MKGQEDLSFGRDQLSCCHHLHSHTPTYASFMLANPKLEVGRRPDQILGQVVVKLHKLCLQSLHSFRQVTFHRSAKDFRCPSIAVEKVPGRLVSSNMSSLCRGLTKFSLLLPSALLARQMVRVLRLEPGRPAMAQESCLCLLVAEARPYHLGSASRQLRLFTTAQLTYCA
jgi:hypothetical protein